MLPGSCALDIANHLRWPLRIRRTVVYTFWKGAFYPLHVEPDDIVGSNAFSL